MTKHTPWKVGIVRPNSVTITNSKGKYLATLYNAPGRPGEIEADIRLIIAAPELLLALRTLVNEDTDIKPVWNIVSEDTKNLIVDG